MEVEISKEWTVLRLIKFTVENDCSHLYTMCNPNDKHNAVQMIANF